MEFSQDCERWRIWAQTNLTGTVMQLASAGDAAALTGLLGSQDNTDPIAAARAAAALNFDAAPLSAAWARTGYAIQMPDVAFERLGEAGWEPVPLTGQRSPLTGTPCFAAWSAEKVVGRLETVEVKSLAQQVGEQVGFWAPDSLIAGLIGEAVLGGLAKAVSGGPRTETKRVWKRAAKHEYFLTPGGICYWEGGKGARHAFGDMKAMEFTTLPEEAVQLLIKDNVVVQFRGPNARLLSLVFGLVWRRYWAGRLSEGGLARKLIADRKDPVESPPEALSLGRSFRDLGYLQGAVEYFEIATNAADRTTAAEAFSDLGNIWFARGDMNRARDSFTRAAEFGAPNVQARSLRNLAVTERKAGQPAAAVAACERAIETNHPDYGPDAMFVLGAIYENDLNDPVSARRAYERAMESRHADYAPNAAYSCGMLLRKLGDNVAAVECLQRSATSGHRDWGPRATFWLAQWYGLDWNDPVTARRLLEEVVASGHTEWAAKARDLLAQRPFTGAGQRL